MNLQTRHRVTKDFYLDEFFSMETYEKLTLQELLSRLNMAFILDIQKLRTNLNTSLTINNWWQIKFGKGKGKLYQWRGDRNPNCKEYSKGSMHTLVLETEAKQAAYDLTSRLGGPAMRKHIRNNREEYPSFRRMEKGVSWLHVDTKNIKSYAIHEFGKTKK